MFLHLLRPAPRGSLFVQAFIPEPAQNIHVAATDGGGLHVPASFARKTRAKHFGTMPKCFANPLKQVKSFGLVIVW